jgi:hypothetical protein
VLLARELLASRPIHVPSAFGDSSHVKTTALIGLVLLAYLTLAAVQDEPIQVWLFVLAPFALIAVALVLHITDLSKYN